MNRRFTTVRKARALLWIKNACPGRLHLPLTREKGWNIGQQLLLLYRYLRGLSKCAVITFINFVNSGTWCPSQCAALPITSASIAILLFAVGDSDFTECCIIHVVCCSHYPFVCRLTGRKHHINLPIWIIEYIECLAWIFIWLLFQLQLAFQLFKIFFR